MPSATPTSPALLIIITIRPPPRPTLFPYTTLFRSETAKQRRAAAGNDAFLDGCAGGVHGILNASLQGRHRRSEEHTSELQSRGHLVCRLLLEKKKRSVAASVPRACGTYAATCQKLD